VKPAGSSRIPGTSERPRKRKEGICRRDFSPFLQRVAGVGRNGVEVDVAHVRTAEANLRDGAGWQFHAGKLSAVRREARQEVGAETGDPDIAPGIEHDAVDIFLFEEPLLVGERKVVTDIECLGAMEGVIAIELPPDRVVHDAVGEADPIRDLDDLAIDGQPIERGWPSRFAFDYHFDVDSAEIDAAGAVRRHFVDAVYRLAVDFIEQPPGLSSFGVVPDDAAFAGGKHGTIMVYHDAAGTPPALVERGHPVAVWPDPVDATADPSLYQMMSRV
jgi:hypothetical protein